MNRPILKLKPPAPRASEAPALPPRGPKGPSADRQLLSFVVDDRKRHHHATYEAAAQERDFLEAKEAAEKRRGKWRPKFRVIKVLNMSGAQLEGRVVVADTTNLDAVALDAARCEMDQSGDVAKAIRVYLEAIRDD